MLPTFIKLPFVFKIFVLPIFEWPLKTGFTVTLLQGYVQAEKVTNLRSHNNTSLEYDTTNTIEGSIYFISLSSRVHIMQAHTI